MTVQELINRLTQIEDTSQTLLAWERVDGCVCTDFTILESPSHFEGCVVLEIGEHQVPVRDNGVRFVLDIHRGDRIEFPTSLNQHFS